jgi:hypothetical protein
MTISLATMSLATMSLATMSLECRFALSAIGLGMEKVNHSNLMLND